MTVLTTTSTVSYQGNGATKSFDFAFKIPLGALVITITSADGAESTPDEGTYTVTGYGNANGGTVTFASAPAVGVTVTLARQVDLLQEVALTTGSAFYAEVIEAELDRLTMVDQQLREGLARAVKVPVGLDSTPEELLDELLGTRDAAALSAAAAAASAATAGSVAEAASTVAGGIAGVSVAWWGAIPDGVELSTAVMTAGSAVLTVTGAAFTVGDVGKLVVVSGAGANGAPLYSTIAARSSATVVTLAAVASTSVSGAQIVYGTDQRAAMQAAFTATKGGTVFIPAGIYMLSASIVLPFASATSGSQVVVSRVLGAGMSLTSLVTAGDFYALTYSSGATYTELGELAWLRIQSEYGVKIGDRTALTSDTGGGGAYKQRWWCHHVEFRSHRAASGIGIDAAKLFKFAITNCHFSGIGTGILLAGCDNGLVENNSIRGSRLYGIYERSAQTFGSQTIIRGNEILGNTGTSTVYIKSNSRHVSIIDNYLECDYHAVTIDLTDIDAPAWFGANIAQGPYTIVVRDNRIEGGNNASVAQYRVNRDQAYAVTIDDRWQGGANWGGGLWVDDSGVVVDTIKPARNGVSSFDLRLGESGRCFGELWANFRTTTRQQVINGRLVMPATDTRAPHTAIDANFALRVRGQRWVLPAGWSSSAPARLFWQGTGADKLLTAGRQYKMSLLARTTYASGGDVLVAGYGSNGSILNTSSFTLSNDFKRFEFYFTPWVVSGPFISLGASTSLGDIEVADISIEQPVVSGTPAFSARVNTTAGGVTGAGGAYTVLPETVNHNPGGYYNPSTGIFTAPATGRYWLSAAVRLGGVTSAHTVGLLQITTSNRSYQIEFNPYAGLTSDGRYSTGLSVEADMDAGDTASMQIAVFNGTAVVSVVGGNNYQSRFQGRLVEIGGATW
ncbi:NosD domain-containing protein [Insolitispirillum peregrinum]|uniref:NosD domain-containing protein n=1 Tax=Insolitispirillum peregrinum TaxID=80876 RepID=UPI00361C3724